MADFKKLLVWQKAHALALNVNRVAGQIRGSAHVSLRSQMIRAAMSIDANIVEGRGQKSERDFARFLGYAINSANELESHLIMARDVDAMKQADFLVLLGQLVEVRKMLHGLVNKIGTVPFPLSTQPAAD
jgi:four helix bundle protein